MMRFDRKPAFEADMHGRGRALVGGGVGLEKASAAPEGGVEQTACQLNGIGVSRVP